MHWEKRRNRCCSAAGIGLPVPRRGAYLRHAASAFLNGCELGSRPLPFFKLSEMPPLSWTGSGKFASPCERMHCENLSSVS